MDIHCFHLHESTISQFVFKVNKKILTILSKNDILISKKSKKGGIQVTVQKAEDVKDAAAEKAQQAKDAAADAAQKGADKVKDLLK